GPSAQTGVARPPAVRVPPRRSPGPWSRAGRRVLRNRVAMSGAGVLVLLVFVAAIVPVVVQIDPYQQHLMDSRLPPRLAVHVLGSGLDKAMLAVGLGGIPRYARIVRGSVLALRHQLFVDAARSLGASDRRLMLVHVAPHALGPLITLATLGLATAMLATASLS